MTTPDAAAIPPDMTWEVVSGRYALVGVDAERGSGVTAELARALESALGAEVGQVVRDGTELTFLVSATAASALLRERPDAACERDLVWIRFRSAMTWNVVGFLARVTSRLAAAGVPLGAVCGYSHDHLFVAARYLDTVREVLGELFPEHVAER